VRGARRLVAGAGAKVLLRGRRRLGLVAVAATLVSGIIASDGPLWGEVGATEAVNGLPDLVIDAFELVMQLGTRPAIFLVAAVAVVVAGGDWKRVAAAVVLAGGIAWLGASLGKDLVDRPRPAAYSDEIVVHGGSSSSGWPSSHTAVAAGSLTAAALMARRPASAAVVLAGVVGLARMAVGVHLPLDVVGGLGLGVATAVVVVWLVDR
jgi:undecaprenyl-diphosphatase